MATETLRLLAEAAGSLWQASGTQLGELLELADRLAALAGGLRVAVTAEAAGRGEVAASQCANVAGWVAAHAPSLAHGSGAGQVARLVEQTARKPLLAPVLDAVVTGRLPVAVAQVVLSEFDRLRTRVVPDAHELVVEGLVQIGVAEGAREVRRLRPAMMARYGLADELQRDQDRAAGLVALSSGWAGDDGTWDYRLVVDAEGKAVLEAAIGPLSAPWHPGGVRDPRSSQQRRGQALLEVCRRVTAAAKAAGPFGGFQARDSVARQAGGGSDPGGRPRAGTDTQADWPAGAGGGQDTQGEAAAVEAGAVQVGAAQAAEVQAAEVQAAEVQAALAGMGAGGSKATLMVTMSLSDLQERVGAGAVLGTTEEGAMLAPETARRVACDARVIPVVLGGRGEVLELGRAERLFTPAQARAVLLRDRHCTFPRCDAPAFWCDVHHVTHWADGGPTDRSNAALLCARHHTIVHRDRLTATVTTGGVRWDTRPGSYDAALVHQTSRSA
jgi:hypothetical protein